MASLASAYIRKVENVPEELVVSYTFGMPRVGNYDYAYAHDLLVTDSWRVVRKGDPVPHFPTYLPNHALTGGPYHHGIEAYYDNGATSETSNYKECHGKPFNEDVGCSFSNNPLSFRVAKHTNYFGIEVGTFWKNGCKKRAKREANSTEIRKALFVFPEGRCKVYFPSVNGWAEVNMSSAESAEGHTWPLRAILVMFACVIGVG